MTFKKFEFWLVTLAAIIAVVILVSIFYEDYYFPYVRENKQLPDIPFYFKTLGVRIGIVLLIYFCFLFENIYVFGRLYSKKKYDLVVLLTILGLLVLLGGLFYLDSLVPDLFRNKQYIPVTVAFYVGFLFYILLKKMIQHYGAHLVPGPVKRKITAEVLFAFAIWLVIFIIIVNGNSGVQRILVLHKELKVC